MKRFRHIILLCALLLFPFCGKLQMGDEQYLRLQRQKIAAALASGVNTGAMQELADEIRAGAQILHVDFSLDVGGAVAFRGTVRMEEFINTLDLLDGTMPVEEFRKILSDAAEFMDIAMFYDGRTDNPSARIELREKRLRDSFGEFLAYQPVFHFQTGAVASVTAFFESNEFAPYRAQLIDFFSLRGND